MTLRKLGEEKLNPEQLRELTILLAEARDRGIDVSTLVPKEEEEIKWNVDENGYFIKRDGTHFIPNSDDQKGFVHSNARFVALFSGRGGGKSAAAAQKAMKKIQQGHSGIILNPSFESLKDSTWPELREWIDWEQVIPKHRNRRSEAFRPNGPFEIVFLNGATMTIKGVKDPDSARGPNLNWLWYDEAAVDTDGLGWQIAGASIRIGDDPQSWVSTTPRGKEHWVYRFFVKKEIPTEAVEIFKKMYLDSDRELVQMYFNTINDNRENLSDDYYAAMLAAYPSGALREQELNGVFVDIGGALGKREWFIKKRMTLQPPEDLVKKKVRFWDLAATEKKLVKKKSDEPDFTYGGRLSQLIEPDKRFVIEHMVGGQWSWRIIKEMIVETALMDGREVVIYIEQEPGAGGKNQVAEIASIPELAGFTVRGHKPEGDKVMRATAWFSKAELGLVWYVQGSWNEDFLDQVGGFPLQKQDDMIDAVSGCFQTLAPVRKWSKPKFRKI